MNDQTQVNVGDMERLASGAVGLCLAGCGLSSQGVNRVLLPLAGGALIYRAVTGYCPLYNAIDADTAADGDKKGVRAGSGVKVERSVQVNRAPAEVYRLWRQLDRLPEFMSHLSEVKDLGNGKSHWVARGPVGTSVSWDAEIVNDRASEMIAWRSLPGSMVDTAGSVHFVPSGKGTEVRVTLKYDPPGGQVGATLARWMGESPETQLGDDLERFREAAESGQARSGK